jgi:hypothetical protein
MRPRRPARPMRPSDHARTQRRRVEGEARRAARDAARPPRTDQPPWWRQLPGMPVDWSRSTMAHLCSAYPFHADRGFGVNGVYVGVNVTGGMSAFYFDPFEFYPDHVTNPNVIVFGAVGTAKSSTVKALVKRGRAVFPERFTAIIDPKGEYQPLAEALGLPVVKLHPGGRHRLNPMEAGTGGDVDDAVLARQGFAIQLVAGVLGRPLTPVEEAVVGWSVDQLSRRGDTFTLVDLARELESPDLELLRMARMSPLEMGRALAPVTFAVDKLCTRTLRGMFDAPTNVTVDWEAGPGVVLDLSAVYDNEAALPLVMLAASYWLGAALRRRRGRQSLQLIDEAWAAVRHGAEYFQSSLKLARTYGVATVLVCHRPSDLTAQNDDGTATAKIAAGLLSDIQTRILLRQPPEQVPATAELLDLSERERADLGLLVRGRAIWKIANRSAVVQLVRGPGDAQTFDTDAAMTKAAS